jgi:uncharacterized low-complexity protein
LNEYIELRILSASRRWRRLAAVSRGSSQGIMQTIIRNFWYTAGSQTVTKRVVANDRKQPAQPFHLSINVERNPMSNKTTLKPLAVAMGAAFVTSLAGTGVANAADNPFAMSDLSSGYQVAEMAEGKCGGKMTSQEGKCGGKMTSKEVKCGEGKCGMQSLDANGDGTITKQEFMQGHEAMFGRLDTNGDGVLDKSEQNAGMKMMMEGRCGEGKCGEKMNSTEGKCGAKKDAK